MAKRKTAARPAPPTSTSPIRTSWTVYAALIAIAVAVYANGLANGFITDDKLQLLGNPLVTNLHRLPDVFGSGVWSFLGYQGNYYRPAPFLIYGLLYALSGAHAFAFHCLLLLLHAANTVLLYALARRLLANAAPWAAWISAALFAVHPIHTEAVDWIAALPDVLLTTLALAGLLAFMRQNGEPNRRQSAVHWGVFFLALLTKETGVMLPFLYAGYQWIMQAKPAAALRHNAPLYGGMIAAFALYLSLRVHALGGLAPAQQTFIHLPFAAFVMSAVVIAASYFAALVWPAGLNFFHIFNPTTQPTFQLFLAAATLVLIGWVALRFRFRWPVFTYGIFWIAMTIAPALNLSGVGQNVFAERYLYLPSVGFALIAAWAWSCLKTDVPSAALPLAAAVLVVCSVVTVIRNPDWKDDFTLLQVTLRQSPESGYLHNLMAGVWVERDQFRRALDEQRLAVRYEPRSVVFHKNLGNILLGFDVAGAAREFETVTALQPTLAEGHFDLGLADQSLGDSVKASAEYERALTYAPNYVDAMLALAQLKRAAGKTEEASALAQRAETLRRSAQNAGR